MIKKIAKRLFKGLHTDNDLSFQPPDTIRESHNGSFVHTGDGNFTWKNNESTKKLYLAGSHKFDVILGMVSLNEKEIILEADRYYSDKYFYNPTLIMGLTNDSPAKHIIALTSQQTNSATVNCYPLLIDDNLNFNEDYPIRDFHIEKEHEESIKVYFNDAYNPPRVIEVLNTINADKYIIEKYLFNIKAEYLDLTPNIEGVSNYFEHNRKQVSPSGNLYCRTYFVTHRLIFTNGASTSWSPMVRKTVIPKNIIEYNAYLTKPPRHNDGYGFLQGGLYNETSRFHLDIEIDNLPDVDKTIQIAVFDSMAYNASATGTIIIDEELTGNDTSYNVKYKGNRNLGTVSIEEVMANDRAIKTAGSMTYIDNRLAIADFLDDFSLINTDDIGLRQWKNVSINTQVYYIPFNDEDPGYVSTETTYGPGYKLQGLKGNNYGYKGDYVYDHDSDDYDSRYTRWWKTWYKKSDNTYVQPTEGNEAGAEDMTPTIRIQKYEKSNGEIEYRNIDATGYSNAALDYKSYLTSSELKGYWRDEWYRFGVIPWKNGRSLGIRWIGDKQMPSLESEKMLRRLFREKKGNRRDGYHYEYNWYWELGNEKVATNKWLARILSVIINNLDITDLVEEDDEGNPTGCIIDGFSIVRAPRDENILSEGIVTGAYHYDTGLAGIQVGQYPDIADEYVNDTAVFKYGLPDYWRGGNYEKGDFAYTEKFPSDIVRPKSADRNDKIENCILYYTPENFYDFEGNGRIVSANEYIKTETVLRETNNVYDTREEDYYQKVMGVTGTEVSGTDTKYNVTNPRDSNHAPYLFNPIRPRSTWLKPPVNIVHNKYGNKKDMGEYMAYVSQSYKEGIWTGDDVNTANYTKVQNVYQIADGLGKYEISEANEYFYNKCAVGLKQEPHNYYTFWQHANVGEGSKAQLIVTTNERLNVNLNLEQWGVQYVSHRKNANSSNSPYDSSDAGLKNSTYILCGHYQEITTDILNDIKKDNKYVFNKVQVFGGDTYIVPMNFARIKPSTHDCNKATAVLEEKWTRFSNEDDDRAGSNLLHAVSFPVQSKVNTLLKTGNDIMKDGFRPYTGNIGTYFSSDRESLIEVPEENGFYIHDASKSTKNEDFNYNTAYSSDHVGNLYTPLITDIETNLRHIYDWTWTEQKTSGETIDSFRSFPLNNIRSTKRGQGKITKIMSHGQRILIIQEDGVNQSHTQREALSSQEEAELISLGISDSIFPMVYTMSEEVSLKDYFACIKGNNGIYFIDKKNKDFVIIENFQTVKSLALEKGILSKANALLRSSLNNENLNKVCRSTNDFLSVLHNDYDDEIMFIIKQANDYGSYSLDNIIVYSEKYKLFTETLPSKNITGIDFHNSEYGIVSKSNELHFIKGGYKYNSFLGKQEDAKIQFIVNDELSLEKIFSILEIVGNENLFNKIKIETEYDTFEENLVSSDNESISRFWRYYNNRWHGSFPVNEKGQRVTGNYIAITLSVNASNQSNVKLSELIIGYRKNF